MAPSAELLDLRGRVAIVTGANSGIGLYILFHLARQGAKCYLAARSQAKFDVALKRLREEGLGSEEGDGEVMWLELDLCDPVGVRKSVERFGEMESRLDILVNNAARILGPYASTKEGLSESFLVNHISPFLFTTLLLPLMEKAAALPDSDVRIVNVSSVAHRWVPNPRYDTLEAINSDFAHTWKPKTNAYAYTKLANILFTRELQRRLTSSSTPIIVCAVNPGNVMSEGNVALFTSLPFGRLINFGFSLMFVSPRDGGYTPAWAAASRKIREERESGVWQGSYVVPYGVREEPTEDAKREDPASELWETTERVLKQFGWA
ncbi:NAD-P-binding protein [Peniophora sp. CONT]|nr:NAD-P-binding protein [Peniophora sp. CONT]